MPELENLKTQLGSLSQQARAELAHYLLSTLDPDAGDESEVAAAWEAEAARRIEGMRTGQVQGRPVEQVFSELRGQKL